MTVGISATAHAKLSTLRRDILSLSPDERLAFVVALRSKRIRPPAAPKPPKPIVEKKPRAPRKKKTDAPNNAIL